LTLRVPLGDVYVPRRALAGAGLAAVAVGAVAVSPGAVLGRLEAVSADPLLFGVALLALYLVRPFLAIPTTLCAAVVGYGYGVYGIPVALAGAGLTAIPPYYAARWTLRGEPGTERSGVVGWLAGSANRVREAGRTYFSTTGGVRGVTAARLIPIPADVVTCAAGASGVSVGALVAGTVIGEVPWTVGAVLVGASAGRLATVGDFTAVGAPVVVAAAAGAALLLLGPLYRYLEDGPAA
jgi:uncharacterized membrane protein YdjX (TVP38/TMEM64 family)